MLNRLRWAFAPALLTLSALTLPGCGSGTPIASGDLVIAYGPEQRLISLTDLDQRVGRVSHRLSTANADLCPTVRNSAGWLLHAASQYSLELRPYAEARFGLDGDLPGLLAVPEGSAAAIAGLRRGDLIIGVNGQPLARGIDRGAAAFEGVEANIRRLDLALSGGPVEIAYRRDGADRSIRVTPQSACGYEVQLNPSDELNARADGRRLFISTALAGFAEGDDELAIILGHELAHHVLGHRSWNETGGGGRMENADRNVVDARGHPERQADRVGLFLAARAGFDTSVASVFWRRFGASNWRVRYPQWGHDSAGARAEALDAVQAEIEARRAASQPLIP